MKTKEKAIYVLLGMVFMFFLAIGINPVIAAMAEKTIKVSTGVSIYIDDKKLNPTDANGNPVEVFIYNGTTYLPLRAISEALDKPVTWDGKTRSVYVGKHDSTEPAVLIANLDYFTGNSVGTLSHSVKDNMGNMQYNCISGNFNNVYKINGKYRKIGGILFQSYEDRSEPNGGTIEIYGDGKLLYKASVEAGVEPIDFSVDITGVLEMKIYARLYREPSWISYDYRSYVANFGLYT